MEYWSRGVMGLEGNTPILLYSNTPISITRLNESVAHRIAR